MHFSLKLLFEWKKKREPKTSELHLWNPTRRRIEFFIYNFFLCVVFFFEKVYNEELIGALIYTFMFAQQRLFHIQCFHTFFYYFIRLLARTVWLSLFAEGTHEKLMITYVFFSTHTVNELKVCDFTLLLYRERNCMCRNWFLYFVQLHTIYNKRKLDFRYARQ